MIRKISLIFANISSQGYKAIWADHVFSTLASPNILKVDIPLIDYIKNVPITNPKMQGLSEDEQRLSNEAKTEVMKMYSIVDGVQIPI